MRMSHDEILYNIMLSFNEISKQLKIANQLEFLKQVYEADIHEDVEGYYQSLEDIRKQISQ